MQVRNFVKLHMHTFKTPLVRLLNNYRGDSISLGNIKVTLSREPQSIHSRRYLWLRNRGKMLLVTVIWRSRPFYAAPSWVILLFFRRAPHKRGAHTFCVLF